jgi:endonuclease/exonuclease/phosphatase family metal-dependent hydrolase
VLETFSGARELAPLTTDERAIAAAPVTVPEDLSSIRICTYNIHTCIGVDRRYDPDRIVAVLREIDADIACLQEVDARPSTGRPADQWAYLAAAIGCRVILGAGIDDHRRRFRNAILTRLPVLSARSLDLTVAYYEPRGAIDADLKVGERALRVLATHFGLRATERQLQANRLMAVLGESATTDRRKADAVLLMGDLNEWRGRTGAIRLFDQRLGPSAAERTFPSWLPVLALDRIYAGGPAMLRDVSVYRSPLARLASDHLPLVGSLCWGHATSDIARDRNARIVERNRSISKNRRRPMKIGMGLDA